MKHAPVIAVALILAVGTASSAFAADLPAKPYTKAPPPAVVAIYDWSGFYLGANAGYANSRDCWNFVTFAGAPRTTAEGCDNAGGAVVGGQVGYRWQLPQRFVLGLEAQGDWAGLSGSRIATPAFVAAPNDLRINSRVRGLGLFTGQVGYAWDNVLLYAKGGAAVVDDRFFHTFAATNALINSATQTRVGGTVGAGVEFGFAPNWSVGVEYDHLFMGRKTVNFVAAPGGIATSDRIGQNVDMVTARINYRFGGPSVPKY